MSDETKKSDNEPLFKLEFGKGWKKLFSKFKAWQIAVLIIVIIISFLIAEFLNRSLESSLRLNPNLLVVVIIAVLVFLYFIVTYAIDAVSKDEDKNPSIENEETIKEALINELTVIRDDLAYAVNNGHKLPKARLPLITDVYDTVKAELSLILKPKKLSIIQRAYAQIKQVGSSMKSGNTLFRGYIELAGGDHVIYQHNLNDEITLIEQAIAELR